MSDDLDLDMEVVKGDELDDLAGGESSPEMEEPERTELSKNPGPEEGEGASMLTAGANGNREWRRKPLEVVSDIIMGSSPKSEYYNESEEGPPFLQANNEFGYRSPTADRWCSNPAKRCKKGDLLMTIRGTYVGQMNLADDDYCIGRGLAAIAPGDDLNGEYLFHYLDYIESYVKSIAAGSTFDSVSSDDIESLEVKIPPLPEQRKIASVLYTVDQAIQKTEAIIEQIRVVEKGLFQKLFSGEHLGRRKREASTLGEIPVHWEVRRMGEVCDITMGSSPKSKYYNERGEGLPFFQANNEFGLRNPTHDRWCSSPVKTASSGDVLMTIRGTYVGQVNVSDRKCCIGRGLAAISSAEHYHPEFLYHHLRSREHYVKSIAIGSTFDSVSSGDLQKLDVVVPPVEEQRVIADTLQSIQNEMLECHRYVERLRRVKKGLMQDLLTGEVRTADEAIEVLDEVKAHG